MHQQQRRLCCVLSGAAVLPLGDVDGARAGSSGLEADGGPGVGHAKDRRRSAGETTGTTTSVEIYVFVMLQIARVLEPATLHLAIMHPSFFSLFLFPAVCYTTGG